MKEKAVQPPYGMGRLGMDGNRVAVSRATNRLGADVPTCCCFKSRKPTTLLANEAPCHAF